jgi:hypothetical protein
MILFVLVDLYKFLEDYNIHLYRYIVIFLTSALFVEWIYVWVFCGFFFAMVGIKRRALHIADYNYTSNYIFAHLWLIPIDEFLEIGRR